MIGLRGNPVFRINLIILITVCRIIQVLFWAVKIENGVEVCYLFKKNVPNKNANFFFIWKVEPSKQTFCILQEILKRRKSKGDLLILTNSAS